jgi:hypothetical protein
MIVYLVLNLPWMALSIINSPFAKARRLRVIPFVGFLTTIPPLAYMFYRHAALRIPGAYTHYAFFEWSLVVWDIAFDACAYKDLEHVKVCAGIAAADLRLPFLTRLTRPRPLRDLKFDPNASPIGASTLLG